MTALIFLHGNSSDGRFFAPFYHTFSEMGVRCLTCNLAGHGDGERLENYSLNALAQSLATFIADNDLTDYAIVAHSLGGHVALQSLRMIQPRALLTFGVSPLAKPVPMNAFQPHPAMAYFMQADVSDAQLEEMAQWQFPQHPEFHADFIKLFRQTDVAMRPSITASLLSNNYPDEIEALQAATCPVWMVLCDFDQVINHDYFHGAMTAVTNPLVTAKTWLADHTPQLTAPDVFVQGVTDFIQTTLNRSSFAPSYNQSQEATRV